MRVSCALLWEVYYSRFRGLLLLYGSYESSLFICKHEKLFSLVEIQNDQHEGIGNSNVVNMGRLRMFFSKICQNDKRFH